MRQYGDMRLRVQVQVHLHDIVGVHRVWIYDLSIFVFLFLGNVQVCAKGAYGSPDAISRPLYSPFPEDSTERANVTGPAGQNSRATSSTPRLSAIRLGLTGLPEKYNYWKIFANLNFLCTKAKYDLL
jgi:hypothetical protein